VNTGTFHKRLDQAEAALSALQRAYLLLKRGVPPEAWPMAELEAYCDQHPELERLTDAELEALVEAAPHQVATLLAHYLEIHDYAPGAARSHSPEPRDALILDKPRQRPVQHRRY